MYTNYKEPKKSSALL